MTVSTTSSPPSTHQTSSVSQKGSSRSKKKYFIQPKKQPKQSPNPGMHIPSTQHKPDTTHSQHLSDMIDHYVMLATTQHMDNPHHHTPDKQSSSHKKTSNIMRTLSRPHNVLFVSLLLCASAVTGYIMSSLVRSQVADISLPHPQQLLSQLRGTSSLAFWDTTPVETTTNSSMVKQIPNTQATTESQTTEPQTTTNTTSNNNQPPQPSGAELTYQAVSLIKQWHNSLGDSEAGLGGILTPSLANRSVYQRYFDPERIRSFKQQLEGGTLNISAIDVRLSNNSPSEIRYTLSYKRLPTNTTFIEQRRVELRTTTNGLRINKIFCETKGCSRHPIYTYQ